MKTTGFFKVMMVIVFAMASVLTMNAAESEKITNVENAERAQVSIFDIFNF